MKEALLLEKVNMKLLTLPVDGDTAQTGARIKLDTGDRLAFVVSMADSTSSNVVFSLKQHDAASSGTTKALSVDNPYFHKAGAETKFTKVVPGSATDAYDLSTQFASQEGLAIIEVLAEDLDVNNGFLWASLNVADTGSSNTKLLSVLGVVHNLRSTPGYSTDL